MNSSVDDIAPLAGIRVVDFSPLLPGPFASQILADLGADVVKVESLSGDFGRRLTAIDFAAVNRNKRSLLLDLKNAGAPAVVQRLAAWADVAIDGFRPGVAARLGVGPHALRGYNPALVCCALSGYGQTGPWRLKPGHDGNYLAAGGNLSLAGHLAGTPRRAGVPSADISGGFMAVIAILAALRKRDGAGATLDVALSEAALAMTATRGLAADPAARMHLFAENDVFDCADGRQIAMGIVEEHFWVAFVEAVGGVEPRLTAQRFGDMAGRRAHGAELAALLATMFRRRPAAAWLDLFEGRDIPYQLVLEPHEAATSVQVAARGVVVEHGGGLHVPFPYLVDGQPAARFRAAAPAPGQHTGEVLGEIGFSDAAIASLRDAGVVAGAPRSASANGDGDPAERY